MPPCGHFLMYYKLICDAPTCCVLIVLLSPHHTIIIDTFWLISLLLLCRRCRCRCRCRFVYVSACESFFFTVSFNWNSNTRLFLIVAANRWVLYFFLAFQFMLLSTSIILLSRSRFQLLFVTVSPHFIAVFNCDCFAFDFSMLSVTRTRCCRILLLSSKVHDTASAGSVYLCVCESVQLGAMSRWHICSGNS